MAERIFRRKIYEQILTATGNKLYYHTWPTPSGKHNYEIDFLLSRNAKICPIEVKSSTSNLHVSIDEFQKSSQPAFSNDTSFTRRIFVKSRT
jgi:hypothetical protein